MGFMGRLGAYRSTAFLMEFIGFRGFTGLSGFVGLLGCSGFTGVRIGGSMSVEHHSLIIAVVS